MKFNLLIFYIIFIIIIAGCSSKEAVVESPIITGKIEKSMLENDKYAWFESNYQKYNPVENVLESIKQNKSGVSVMVFMGTWCGDSKREIPRFYKIMEKAGFKDIQIFGLDRSKKSPEGIESKYDIKRVPTFIFIKNGEEIGRIIESPEKKLEEDIAKILKRDK